MSMMVVLYVVPAGSEYATAAGVEIQKNLLLPQSALAQWA